MSAAPRLLRKIHYWTSLPLMLTIFVIAVTGSLLALKKDFATLQPPTQSGSRPGDLRQPLADIVAAALPAAKATAADVERIDVRPGDGIAKVVFDSRTEVQVDLASAKVLHVGYRTSDLIETIHDFSFLGGGAKYILSFGSGLALLGMAGTGVYLFVLPMLARRKKRRAVALKTPS
ncbi:MAG: PepSY-associated TM helix domain-containing protein [Sphingomicrobium sp.]